MVPWTSIIKLHSISFQDSLGFQPIPSSHSCSIPSSFILGNLCYASEVLLASPIGATIRPRISAFSTTHIQLPYTCLQSPTRTTLINRCLPFCYSTEVSIHVHPLSSVDGALDCWFDFTNPRVYHSLMSSDLISHCSSVGIVELVFLKNLWTFFNHDRNSSDVRTGTRSSSGEHK